MNTYTVGAFVLCDFHFGGKPKGVCTEVVRPGTGSNSDGEVLVKITKPVGAYRQGEIVRLSSYMAVPVQQLKPPGRGEFFTRVKTDYKWEKP